MGVDKASMVLAGRPMGRWVADALGGAGASTVVLIGGDAATAADLGIEMVPDAAAGSGPLNGLATALSWASDTHPDVGAVLLVTACDQPSLTATILAALVARLLDASDEIAAARFETADGRRQPLPSAWRVELAAGPVGRLHAAGERRMGAAFGVVPTVELATDGAELVDLDTPSDVARWHQVTLGLPADPETPVG